ncbi:mechanosensitive ion channel [bacterium]|nr:mechanosensitive ion channel [bacterium]
MAVAFALQNILTDLFSSFSIILSKPFVVGDYIKI